MHIDRVDLLAFGGFTDASLDFSGGAHPFHLVYGPNESGKSTSLRAITAWLFGVPTQTADSYLHNYGDLRIGGRLSSETFPALECVRRKGKSRTLLTPDESAEIEAGRLEGFLDGIDEETFLRGFGLDRERLIQGGQDIIKGEGDLGEILFSAGVGVSRLSQVRDALDTRRNELFGIKSRTRELNKLFSELKQLRADLATQTLSAAQLQQQTSELASARQAAEELRKQMQTTRLDLETAEQKLEALPLARRRQSLQTELADYQGLPELDDDFAQRRRNAETEGKVANNAAERAAAHLRQLQLKLAEIADPAEWLVFENRIESLAKQVSARQKDAEKLRNLSRQAKEVAKQVEQLRGEMRAAGASSATAWNEQLTATDRTAIRELEEQGIRVEEQLRASQRSWEQQQAELAEAAEAITALPPHVAPPELADALAVIEAPKRLIEACQTAAEECQKLAARAATCTRRLTGFTGGPAAAAMLQLPAEAELQQLAAAWQAAAEQETQTQQAWQAIRQQQQTLRAELAGFTQAGGVPSEAELLTLRQNRDQLLERFLDSSTTVSTEEPTSEPTSEKILQQQQRRESELRTAILEADRMVDAMRHAAEQVARRQRIEQELVTVGIKTDEAEQAARQAAANFAQQQQIWLDTWNQFGVQAGAPEAMAQWYQQHQTLVECVQELQLVEARCEQLEQRRQQWCQQLNNALEKSQTCAAWLAAATPTSDLLTLHARAERVQQEDLRSREQRQELERSHQQAARDCQRAERNHQQAEQEFQQWQTAWQTLVERFSARDDFSPRAFRQLLDTHQLLSQKQAEQGRLAEEQAEIRDELQRFRIDTGRLAAALSNAGLTNLGADDDLTRLKALANTTQPSATQPSATSSAAADSETPALETPALETPALETIDLEIRLASHWQAVLRGCQQQAQQRATLLEQVQLAEQKLEDQRQEANRWDVMLQGLCDEVDCENPAELFEIEQRATQKRQLDAELQQLQQQLLRLARGTELDAYASGVLADDQVEISEQISIWRDELETAEEQLTELNQRIGGLAQAQEANNGNGTAAEINQRIQDRTARAQRLAREYAVLTLQSTTLELAMERYREANQGPIVGRAEAIFQQLTCGAYTQLKPQLDDRCKRVLVGVRSDSGKLVPAQHMSEGTADALFLALRLASLEINLETRQPVPLIIDDVLVQFDDQRSAAALRVLSELASKTQVIFFTHHRHLIELAEQHLPADQFQLHEF